MPLGPGLSASAVLFVYQANDKVPSSQALNPPTGAMQHAGLGIGYHLS